MDVVAVRAKKRETEFVSGSNRSVFCSTGHQPLPSDDPLAHWLTRQRVETAILPHPPPNIHWHSSGRETTVPIAPREKKQEDKRCTDGIHHSTVRLDVPTNSTVSAKSARVLEKHLSLIVHFIQYINKLYIDKQFKTHFLTESTLRRQLWTSFGMTTRIYASSI